jgi:hypothetical protein
MHLRAEGTLCMKLICFIFAPFSQLCFDKLAELTVVFINNYIYRKELSQRLERNEAEGKVPWVRYRRQE